MKRWINSSPNKFPNQGKAVRHLCAIVLPLLPAIFLCGGWQCSVSQPLSIWEIPVCSLPECFLCSCVVHEWFNCTTTLLLCPFAFGFVFHQSLFELLSVVFGLGQFSLVIFKVEFVKTYGLGLVFVFIILVGRTFNTAILIFLIFHFEAFLKEL